MQEIYQRASKHSILEFTSMGNGYIEHSLTCHLPVRAESTRHWRIL